jgi:hypothetical protein
LASTLAVSASSSICLFSTCMLKHSLSTITKKLLSIWAASLSFFPYPSNFSQQTMLSSLLS